MEPKPDNNTHFGYKDVARDEKVNLVRGVFDSVAENYDIMNDLMSVGLHRLWKRSTIAEAGVKPGHRVLDLAGGTGDLAIAFARLVGDSGRVVLADINGAMLEQGRRRVVDAGVGGRVDIAQVNAEELPFEDHSFDRITKPNLSTDRVDSCRLPNLFGQIMLILVVAPDDSSLG